MPSDLTIPARLVAEGVGLPPVWRSVHGKGNTGEGWVRPGLPWDDFDVLDLTDPQTAFGVALRLDAWELAGHVVGAGGWSEAVAWRGDFPTVCGMLAARVRHIGMDHAIRRALGWSVEPGTLATLEMDLGGWRLSQSCDEQGWHLVDEDITDPAEALAAIYAEVCGE